MCVMESFEKIVPSTSKVTDFYQFIPFVSSSNEKREKICTKVLPRGNLNGEEASRFYKEVISSPTNCVESSLTDDHKKVPKVIKEKKLPDNSRLTIFHHAQNGSVEGIERLLSEQCDVDIQDMYGWTPLMCATFEGHYAAVEYLMKCKANLGVKNKQGLTAFDIAMTKNNKTLIELFKNGVVNNSSPSVDKKVQKELKHCNLCNCSYTESTVVHESSISHLFSTKNENISTYYHIPENNKGFQIMLKKGWDKNKGLGLDAKGRKFPIKTVLKTDRTCIGGKREVPKVTHFGPYDHRSVKKGIQPTLNLKRERKLKKREIKKRERKNKQFEIEFRRQFHL